MCLLTSGDATPLLTLCHTRLTSHANIRYFLCSAVPIIIDHVDEWHDCQANFRPDGHHCLCHVERACVVIVQEGVEDVVAAA
jgi:hypothetical protein